MTDITVQALSAKLERLERRLKIWYGLAAALAITMTLGGVLSSGQAQQITQPSAIRARSITIEDERGRDRIVIGAPVPNPKEGQRISPSTGLVINDADGYERFGLGLMPDGRVTMGFDAPRGTGDPRNRERITIGADAKGGAYIRFLNRKTQAAAFLRLDDNDQFSIEFLSFAEKGIARRRLTFDGDNVVQDK